MAQTTEPPASASQTYKALHSTAVGLMSAMSQHENLPSRMNFDRMREFCGESFRHSWGHNYAVSKAPHLQASLDFDGFVHHLHTMLPKLDSWKGNITDVVVDETNLKVILRVSMRMQVKGAEEDEAVENDMMWMMHMEKEGEDVKVSKSVEFLDFVAAGKLREIMMRSV